MLLWGLPLRRSCRQASHVLGSEAALRLLLLQLLGLLAGCVQPWSKQRPSPYLACSAASPCRCPALPLQVQQRKAAIADRLRQQGIPVKSSGVPAGAAQQEAAGSGASGGHARQRLPRGDSAFKFGSLAEPGPAADASSGSGSCGRAAGAPEGLAGDGEVRLDMEGGFQRWMQEVSGEAKHAEQHDGGRWPALALLSDSSPRLRCMQRAAACV